MRRIILILAVVVSIAGCAAQTLQAASVESFAHDTSCPPDRVTAVPRPDVPLPPAPKPPREVAADPGRLAYWKNQHALELAEAADTQAFELDGCGQRRVATCTWSLTWVGENPVNYATCTPVTGS
jgi:hypothetical protein